MTHEQLVADLFQWHWNTFPEERRCLYGVNNNVSAGLSKDQQIIEGNKNKAKGVVAGVYDLCYLPCEGGCVYLDAKVGKDILSRDQLDFRDKCHERGIPCYTFSSLEEGQQIIKSYQPY